MQRLAKQRKANRRAVALIIPLLTFCSYSTVASQAVRLGRAFVQLL